LNLLLDNFKRLALCIDDVTVTQQRGARIQTLKADELVLADQLHTERACATSRTHQTMSMNGRTLLVRHTGGSNARERTRILERVPALETARLRRASLGVGARHGALFVSDAGSFQFSLVCANRRFVGGVAFGSLPIQLGGAAVQFLVQFALLCTRFAFATCLFRCFASIAFLFPIRS
jgi:hypothetical protein